MKRFVVAMVKHETNTFSPVPTPLAAFGRYAGGAGKPGPAYGAAAIAAYRGTATPAGAYIDLAERAGAELAFPIAANATPGGCPEDALIEHAAQCIVEELRKGCDALFLDLHGGMATPGYDDPEGELLARIRKAAPGLPIAVAFDFHTNLSQLTIDNATVITAYRTYPHVDMYQTGERAGRTLMRALAGEIEPRLLWHSLPILSHLNRQTPSRQPMKDIMDRAIAAEAAGTVLNASVLGCFPLADIPFVGMHGIVVVDARRDRGEGQRLLHELMSMAWQRRADFVFEVEPVERSIAHARSLGEGPVLLADHGDVAGSGGSTDVMAVLAEALRQKLTDMCVGPIWDPAAVATMIAAGVGARVELALGGRTDAPAIGLVGAPLPLAGTVRRITDGRFTVTAPMSTGTSQHLGRCAVLDIGQGNEIVISSERHEPFDTGCFTHAGIDPARKRFILIKSRQHFRAGFEPIIRHVVMVSGPGITTSDYSQYPWKRVRRPIYPLDPDTPSNLPALP
ncbi:MAG: M81 family metallopeptidase [Alphaproteobacteria bacterium]|nr:M81 family metallopeptidase [Alphaproteobacteria bacterium]